MTNCLDAATLRQALIDKPDTKLLVIDSLGGFNGVAALNTLVAEYQVSILAVNHRVVGNAETNLVLERKPATAELATLHTHEHSIALRFNQGWWERYGNLETAPGLLIPKSWRSDRCVAEAKRNCVGTQKKRGYHTPAAKANARQRLVTQSSQGRYDNNFTDECHVVTHETLRQIPMQSFAGK